MNTISIEKYLENHVKDSIENSIDNFNRTKKLLSHFINNYHKNAYVYFGLAYYALDLEDYELSLDHVEKGLKLSPDNEIGIALKVETLYKLLDTNENIITYRYIKDHKNPQTFVRKFIGDSLEKFPDNEIINIYAEQFFDEYIDEKEICEEPGKVLQFKKNDN